MWVFFQAVHRGGLSKAAAQHSARDAAVRPGRLRPAAQGAWYRQRRQVRVPERAALQGANSIEQSVYIFFKNPFQAIFRLFLYPQATGLLALTPVRMTIRLQ